MKANRIFICLMLALPALFLQSCLKDQEDVFDKSYSARMEDFLQQAQDSLVNAPYGWAFDYYPEENRAYGGIAYTVKFTKNDASVRYEKKPDDGAITSLYKMKSDDGPVLSFDTYNAFMHLYATPSKGAYQGKQGDFEFVIDSIGKGVIKVHGKKSLNTMYLRKLTEDPAEYMDKVTEISSLFIFSDIELNAGGKPYHFVITDPSNRQMAVYDGSTLVKTVAYLFTDKGLRLYEPVSLNGVPVQEFILDKDNSTVKVEGAEVTKTVVNLDIIAKLIGRLSFTNGEKTITKTIPFLNKVDISCDASWVHFSKDGNQLTIKVDANPVAVNARGGWVTLSNGYVEKKIQITQYDLPALLGNYQVSLTYYNFRKNGFANGTFNGVIRYTTRGGERHFYLLVEGVNGVNYRFPLIYMQSINAFLMQSGQRVTKIDYSNATYFIGNTFNINAKNGTGYSTNAYNLISFNIGDDGKISTALTGGPLLFADKDGNLEVSQYIIERIVLNAYTSEPFGKDNLDGWFDQWLNVTLVKNPSSSAKPSILEEGNNESTSLTLPAYVPNQITRYNSNLHLAPQADKQFRIK